ncbi:MAG: glycosyltransferase family 1 protein [Actinomycetes bacterium]
MTRDEGVRAVAAKALARAGRRVEAPTPPPKQAISMLVRREDALEADWTEPPAWQHGGRERRPYSVAWIMSPPGESSGGHQNLFRFIRFMEQRGHRVTIYLYSSDPNFRDVDGVRRMVSTSPSYSRVSAAIRLYGDDGVAPDTDAIFATGWETAYPVFRDRSRAERFYFVQDFEPYFYAIGSESVLAENTYRFGFYGITAGAWLSRKLSDEYGMATDHFDFGADTTHYNLVNRGERREVFFYARPVTVRRGFELGILAMEQFARMCPEYTINLAGWDVDAWDIPFEHVNLRSLPVSQLNDLYNRCAGALVLSLTNMSLLPLELLASGVIPVLNDGPNNRLVSDNPHIVYSAATPKALAHTLAEVVRRPDLPDVAEAAAASVGHQGWESSGAKFVDIFERVMCG